MVSTSPPDDTVPDKAADTVDDRPAILLVSEEHSEFLLDEFGRYARDYDVRAARSAAEAKATVKGLFGEGRQLALAVSESVLPDDDVLAMFQRMRTYVPTARRLIAAHWTRFRLDAEALRPALAKGKYDAYLLMPRGARDEEFHTAVCEMLSDWGSTVAAPVVETLRIVSPHQRRRDPRGARLPRPHRRPGPRAQPRERDRARGPGQARLGRPALPGRRALGRRALRGRVGARRRGVDLRSSRRHRGRPRGRPRHRRRRPGRARGVGVRRFRGPHDGRHRVRGDRRPGRHQLDDPQLPRLPPGHLRDAAGPARAQPGDPVRHPVLHRLAGAPARGRRRRRAPRRLHRGRRRARPSGRDRLRASPTASSASSRSTRWSAAASTTAPR